MGRCVLLLDALDEVPMDKRKDLHKTIISHLKTLNPNNKICLTSRDRGFIPVKEKIEHFNIEPLDSAQIEQYVDKVIKLKKFNQQDKNSFMEQAKGLVEKHFLNSFLILSLLLNIYKGERQLPETKLDLYQKCLEYIANKREKPKTNDNIDWKLIAPLMKDSTFIELSILCFPNNKEVKEQEIITKLTKVYRDVFIDAATLENAVNELLKFCFERTELFVSANVENTFKFFHRSFFEYFYSKHIVIRCKNSNEIFNELLQFDVDSEIFELTLSRLKQETQDNYTSLVKYVFGMCESSFQSRKPNFKAFNILILFFQVVDEQTFLNELIDLITKNSKLIVENVKAISNQDIIRIVVERTSSQETVINKYEAAAYEEVHNILLTFDPEVAPLYISRKLTTFEEYDIRTIWRQSGSRSFYSTILLAHYSIIDIMRSFTNGKFGTTFNTRKAQKKITRLVEYYDSLDYEEKTILEEFLAFAIQ